MKVSAADFKLTGQDILELIEDYVHLEGLCIKGILIDDVITLIGQYGKKIKIPFNVKIGIGNVRDNNLSLKIYKLNIYKMRILNIIKNALAKGILKDFINYGIEAHRDTVIVNLNEAKKLIPHFDLDLKRVAVHPGMIEISLENIKYEKNKKFPHIKRKSSKYPGFLVEGYDRLREKISRNIPEKYSKISDYILLIPDILVLFWRLFKDNRVKTKVKIILANAILYILSPIDLIPGFIPVFGQIDDIAVAFFALDVILEEVPEKIILENWHGKENIILITREVIKYISEIIGARNFENVSAILKKFLHKTPKRDFTNKL